MARTVKTRNFNTIPENTSFIAGVSQLSVNAINSQNPTDILALAMNSYDYIAEIKKIEIGKANKWLTISDHMPIYCEF